MLVDKSTPVRHLASTDSTNSECIRLANAGHAAPFWVMADQQTRGRGRLHRNWSSKSGNLYASGLYSFETSPEKLAQLGFAAALAVIDAVSAHMPIDVLQLKWPNDVLAEGSKLAGVLLESFPQSDGSYLLVVGIGINIAHAPQLPDRKTACVGQFQSPSSLPVTPAKLLPDLIACFEKWLLNWQHRGFGELRNAWMAKAYGFGEKIVTSNKNEGRFEDMSETGGLLLRQSSGQVIEISAGEVYFATDGG